MTTSLKELYNDVPQEEEGGGGDMIPSNSNASVMIDDDDDDNKKGQDDNHYHQNHTNQAIPSSLSKLTSSSSFHNNNNSSSSSDNNTMKPTTSLLHVALQQQEQLQNSNNTNTNTTGIINTSTPQNNNMNTINNNNTPTECLTNPSKPHSNNGLDNSEGNLIVHKHDMIRVLNQNIRYHDNKKSKGKSKSNNPSTTTSSPPTTNTTSLDPLGVTSFQVLDILGQGTFAQVFKCKNIQTKQICAIKIVKNKQAYTRQAAVEIDIFNALSSNEKNNNNSMVIHLMEENLNGNNKDGDGNGDDDNDYMVELLSYFMYQSHLCLVFELLGLNLYELLKRRQFRGLPISTVRSLVKQAIRGTYVLSEKNIVHCDLKPENILIASDEHIDCLVNGGKTCNNHNSSTAVHTTTTTTTSFSSKKTTDNNEFDHKIKLIDFGSACFEGQAAHTYIQSRFYRSPEVLLGIDYDGAIDMWSLGCVAAELFLGLPILPGIHEHDQLGRICEMIGDIPEWMIEQG